MNNKTLYTTIFWLTCFSIAMGYLETAVVVYLRELYYPSGFCFPLTPIGPDIGMTEFWREAATVIMLIGAGIMAGKNGPQRFAFFMYCFAVWDIFYYIFLYLILGWPESLFTWDILFLIPVPWVGPVIAPCLVALAMILLAVTIIYAQINGQSGKMIAREQLIMIAGILLILFSFMWDYIEYVQLNHAGNSFWSFDPDKDLFSEAAAYVPKEFNWKLFIPGLTLLFGGVILFAIRVAAVKDRKPAVMLESDIKQES
ncbi:MAG TPA: hypothetical protein VI731_00355 [Bacteroidia bacterium]|nr:hypothetical protein [Bacteroidia bacterium]